MAETYQHGLKIYDLLVERREEILRLAAEHGASNMRVFGSEAREDSDVDFLIDWDYNRLSSWGGVGLNLALEKLLGRQVAVVGEDELHQRIKKQVLKEAVPL
jgi:predicted nucleotidyltransferase